MRFEAEKSLLIKALSLADSVVSTKNVNTILTQCLVNVERDSASFIGTDNEIAVKTSIDVLSDDEFSFAINGKKCVSLLKEFPDGIVVFDMDELNVNISSKTKSIKGKYVLTASPSSEYPDISFDFEESIEIPHDVFIKMLKKTMHAAAQDSIKPIFNAVYICNDDNKFCIVATDSRRLSVIKRNIDLDFNIDGVIIPLKTVNEILKLSDNGTCRMSFTDSQCYFKIGDSELVSRVVEGSFPDYKQVIPQDFLIKSIIDVDILKETLNRVKIFTGAPAWKVLLTFKGNLLTIEASYPGQGEAVEEIEISSDSEEEITIGINVQFLIDVLNQIEKGNVLIGITGVMSPVLIHPEDDPDFQTVIMPIQVRSQ